MSLHESLVARFFADGPAADELIDRSSEIAVVGIGESRSLWVCEPPATLPPPSAETINDVRWARLMAVWSTK